MYSLMVFENQSKTNNFREQRIEYNDVDYYSSEFFMSLTERKCWGMTFIIDIGLFIDINKR